MEELNAAGRNEEATGFIHCFPCSTVLFVCVRIPSGVMRINITNNKRHFVATEEVHDRCVVTSAATATWQNVDVVDVQLLAIGHCDRNALLLQMRNG